MAAGIAPGGMRRLVLVSSTVLVVIFLLGTMISITKKCEVPPSSSNVAPLRSSRSPWPSPDGGPLRVLLELREQEISRLAENCSCPDGGSRSQFTDLSKESLRLRDHVYRKWQEREQLVRPRPPLGLCPAKSEFQFVSTGIEIEPLQSIRLVGILSSWSRDDSSQVDDGFKLTFTSQHEFGVLSLRLCVVRVDVEGNNTKEMTLHVARENERFVNEVLRGVVYQSTVPVVDEWDTVNMRFYENSMNIHIHIRRGRLPFLYRISSTFPPIHERVTFLVKTFERYDKVNKLIDSVIKFYPTMTILVADDSVHPQAIEKKNVHHYKMPPETGWFAGRNLLVSQVTTEYFVWADDDFVLKENTKLELFMEKLDKLELKLDVVGGLVDGKDLCTQCIKVKKDRQGQCIAVIKNCNRGHLAGFPQCFVSDRPLNFFMARTRSVQEIGFDPSHHLRHVAHPEFFMDGYHTLRSACCKDVSVGHERGGSVFYQNSRHMHLDDKELTERRQFHAFKYYTKCFDV